MPGIARDGAPSPGSIKGQVWFGLVWFGKDRVVAVWRPFFQIFITFSNLFRFVYLFYIIFPCFIMLFRFFYLF